MGKFSEVMASHRFPLDIDIFPCLHDHCFEGRAVYPAVEAMQVLAASTASFMPELREKLPADVASLIPNIRTDCIENARFDKFLIVPPDAERIPAFNEIDVQADGTVCASLLTRFQSGKGAMTRMITHASLCFNALEQEPAIEEMQTPHEEPKDAFTIPVERIYQELVPFAPAYRNIIDHTWLTPTIGGALVSAAAYETCPGPLGSPFPLDAAFHVACAWSQRFAGIVAFPVGLEQRRIFTPSQTGKIYRASIIPRTSDGAFLMFDIGLYTMDGMICEMVKGVRMRDVSGGRIKPPEWVLKKDSAGGL